MGNLFTCCCHYISNLLPNNATSRPVVTTSDKPPATSPHYPKSIRRPRLILNIDNSDPLHKIIPHVEAITEDIEKYYYVYWKTIGVGSTSKVYQATNKLTGNLVAIKQIDFTRLNGSMLIETVRKRWCRQIENEINILSGISHPNLIGLHEVFQDQSNVYIVTDLYQGDELFTLLSNHQTLPETYVKSVIQQLLSAIQYCHSHNIVHRDLKLENIMLAQSKIGSKIHLIDFGLSTSKTPPYNLLAGSEYYLAPEVIDKFYDSQCDIWSVGVMMYILITGTPPFNASTQTETRRLIQNGIWGFHDSQWKKISQEAKCLLKNLLVVDPTQRYTATQALQCSWFQPTTTTRTRQNR
jgi:calcium-dependent protein kinase